MLNHCTLLKNKAKLNINTKQIIATVNVIRELKTRQFITAQHRAIG